eukprot:GFUD01017273.1.p1 GENE.GFUD01017273.1~~GFUD01017273.1.p1  ORF type:complete len:450 (-),score=171.83 GFUD01017273.1:167-1516(-)
MAGNEQVDQLVSITGVDKEMATNLLEACGGNLEMAVNMHMEDQGGAAGGASGAGGSGVGNGVDDEDDVRAPIPQKQEVMVQQGYEGYMMNNRVNKTLSQRRVRTVFDGFRDFQAETKNMEDRLEAGLPISKSKKRTLEELFKPPLDMMWQGDWQSARDHAAKTNRWLLVNIQDAKEFQCQVLNRDLWSNPGVKAIISEHFVFWQQYKESDDAERYMTFYTIKEWPYVSIIDPRTGENMVTWSHIEAAAFPELMTEFLSLHPCLESPVKEPPRKKVRTDNMVEMDEEAQMAAAIKASLADTLANNGDSSDNSDLETFSDDDSNLSPKKRPSNGVSKDIEKSKNGQNGHTDRLPTPEDDDPSWESFLGSGPDSSTILIRWPDGSRDPWSQPADSKLQALLLFISFKGFSLENHEVVTNFPRRQVNALDTSQTLKEVGLYPRETVFVQVKDC